MVCMASGPWPIYLSERLNNDGDSLSAANTGGPQPVALPLCAQCMQKVRRDAGARRGQRVAESDRAAVNVQLLARQLELGLHGARLRSERLVDLDEVHVVERHLRRAKRVFRRRDWSDPHDLGIDACHTPRHEATERLLSRALRVLLTRDHERARAVTDSGGIASRDETVGSEIRLQLAERFHRRIRTHVLVARELRDLTLPVLDGDGHDLVGEDVRVPRLLREHLRPMRKLIDARPLELVLHREILGGLGHRQPRHRILEGLPEGVLERGRLAERSSPSQPARDVRRLRHGFAPAHQAHVRFTEQNLLRAVHDRLKSGSTEAIDGERGCLDGASRFKGDVPRKVDGVDRRLEDVAEDRMLNLARSNACPIERGLCRLDGEVDGGVILERAAERAEWCTDRGQKDDVAVGRLSHERAWKVIRARWFRRMGSFKAEVIEDVEVVEGVKVTSPRLRGHPDTWTPSTTYARRIHSAIQSPTSRVP